MVPPETSPQGGDSSIDQTWVDESAKAIEDNRVDLTPDQQVQKLKEMVKACKLDDLQGLAAKIIDNGINFSDGLKAELAERVRALVPEEKLQELLESEDRSKRLEILKGRFALLQLLSEHLRSSLKDKAVGWIGKGYKAVMKSPVGKFLKGFGFTVADTSVAVWNKMRWGFFWLMEHKPSLISAVIPGDWPISKFVKPEFYRERRTRMEVEDRIKSVVEAMRIHGKTRAERTPHIVFAGFDLSAFNALKEKHKPKDAKAGPVLFTPDLRLAILQDVAEATANYIQEKQKAPETDGKTKKTKITIAMKDLVNFDPVKMAEEKEDKATEDLKEKVAKLSEWNGKVKSVEFGKDYVYEDGKLTIPKDSIDENGKPKTDEGSKLQEMLPGLPSAVKKFTVVGDGEQFVLNRKELKLPINRPEKPEHIKMYYDAFSTYTDLSTIRFINSRIITRGSIRFVVDSSKNVLELGDNNTLPDIKIFLEQQGVLSKAKDKFEWWNNEGKWEDVRTKPATE